MDNFLHLIHLRGRKTLGGRCHLALPAPYGALALGKPQTLVHATALGDSGVCAQLVLRHFHLLLRYSASPLFQRHDALFHQVLGPDAQIFVFSGTLVVETALLVLILPALAQILANRRREKLRNYLTSEEAG